MNRKGFTLIELLTVIAIIAILAAIIFPVGARVKAAGLRSSDMSNLNDIRNAIQLYKTDQEVYPPQLLGYATLYFPLTGDGQVVPADKARGYIFPRPLGISDLNSNQNRVTTTQITTAVWPPKDSGEPQLDLNGDGKVDSSDSAPQAYDTSVIVRRNNAGQATEPSDKFQLGALSASDELANEAIGRSEEFDTATYPSHKSQDSTSKAWIFDAYFYNISGYDVGTVKVPGGGTRTELHYSTFWSVAGLHGGDKNDDPRQLGYAEPPDNTVVTWNSYWREYDSVTGNPTSGKNDMVLFLGGGAKLWPSDNVAQHSWRLVP
jgi:prepilin-type N-terminal cleavage/methylation domain-containing protein